MSAPATRDVLDRMRRDWDDRAAADAERFVYSRDSESDEPDFERSGRANYDQLVRPFLPVLLEGRSATQCRVLEIGCGVGRMTRWFAAEFGHVDALDISPVMLTQARARLARASNIEWHLGDGETLAPLSGGSIDLVFSYIVFQHVPSKDVIAAYIREAARVLRDGGVFKFQVNGARTTAAPNTWTGVSFSLPEIRMLLEAAGFHLFMSEGVGTQYFVLTCRKGSERPSAEPRAYIFPGEIWAEKQMLSGWGEVVDGSWRRVDARFECELAAPQGSEVRLFLAIYFWPEPEFSRREITIVIGRHAPVNLQVERAGDYYAEIATPNPEGLVRVRVAIEPEFTAERRPALRAIGLYALQC